MRAARPGLMHDTTRRQRSFRPDESGRETLEYTVLGQLDEDPQTTSEIVCDVELRLRYAVNARSIRRILQRLHARGEAVCEQSGDSPELWSEIPWVGRDTSHLGATP